MSYHITINGHLDDVSKEAAIVESLKECVAGLEGVQTANFSGASGSFDLKPQNEPTPSEVGTSGEGDNDDEPATD